MGDGGAYTTFEAAAKIGRGAKAWMVRNAYDRGKLPAPRRFRQYRVILEEDLPALEEALEGMGYFKAEPATVGTEA